MLAKAIISSRALHCLVLVKQTLHPWVIEALLSGHLDNDGPQKTSHPEDDFSWWDVQYETRLHWSFVLPHFLGAVSHGQKPVL